MAASFVAAEGGSASLGGLTTTVGAAFFTFDFSSTARNSLKLYVETERGDVGRMTNPSPSDTADSSSDGGLDSTSDNSMQES